MKRIVNSLWFIIALCAFVSCEEDYTNKRQGFDYPLYFIVDYSGYECHLDVGVAEIYYAMSQCYSSESASLKYSDMFLYAYLVGNDSQNWDTSESTPFAQALKVFYLKYISGKDLTPYHIEDGTGGSDAVYAGAEYYPKYVSLARYYPKFLSKISISFESSSGETYSGIEDYMNIRERNIGTSYIINGKYKAVGTILGGLPVNKYLNYTPLMNESVRFYFENKPPFKLPANGRFKVVYHYTDGTSLEGETEIVEIKK